MIAGLESPTTGEVLINGDVVNEMPTRARGVGFLFPGYALFEHMTVADNIVFGLKIKRVPKKERRRRLEEMVSMMGLEGIEGLRPSELSGAQQQRVALARALATRPRLLLLDEPFGAVDAKARRNLRVSTRRWQRDLKVPTIMVTRDYRDAMEMGDRVAVMNAGRIEQLDSPQDVYDAPATEFVARFIGKMSVASAQSSDSRPAEVVVRPQDIGIYVLNGRLAKDNGLIPGPVTSYTFLGRKVRIDVELDDRKLITLAIPNRQVSAKGPARQTPVGMYMDSS